MIFHAACDKCMIYFIGNLFEGFTDSVSDEKEEAPRKHFHGPKPGEIPDVNKINYVQELISNTLSENCIPLDYNTICGMASFLLANLLGQHRCIEDIISTVIDNLDHASFEMVDIRKPS